jgi:hypothetical protein
MNLHGQTILVVEDNDDDAELTVMAFDRAKLLIPLSSWIINCKGSMA